jgi:hypothetical protein
MVSKKCLYAAHNPKVVGSNPAPAANQLKGLEIILYAFFFLAFSFKL